MAFSESDLRAYARNREDNLRIVRKRAGEYVAAYDKYLATLAAGQWAEQEWSALEAARHSLALASKHEDNNVEYALNAANPKRKR